MKSKIYLTIQFSIIILLGCFSNNVSGQAWDPESLYGTTSHLGYVLSGNNTYNGKFQSYGTSWTNFFHMNYRNSSTRYGRMIIASDGMLFRNYDPNTSISFSFRNNNDEKLITVYRDNGDVNIGTYPYSFPTAVKLRVIDPDYPSLMIAKTTSSTGDISIAAGTGMYSNLSAEDDFIIRSSSGDLILTARKEEGVIKFATGDMDGTTWLGDSEKMIITNNGNVGIGTSTPGNELEVNGTIRAREIMVEDTNWPDYVFSEDYQLNSLDNVAKFISKNGHLPEIPSAEEIKESGINVGEMQTKLLKKIEELTLYIIEQDKRIMELERE